MLFMAIHYKDFWCRDERCTRMRRTGGKNRTAGNSGEFSTAQFFPPVLFEGKRWARPRYGTVSGSELVVTPPASLPLRVLYRVIAIFGRGARLNHWSGDLAHTTDFARQR